MTERQNAHPNRETLAAFGLGKLQPAEAMAVETHIADCEECCDTLSDLGNDTFADLVRQSDAVELHPTEQTTGLVRSQSEAINDLPEALLQHSRYCVLELLGKGGMGNVYKAQHSLMNRTVALKVINRELVKNAQAVERFRREVQSAAQLSHPNIVTAHDAEQAGDMHLLVMEFVPGDNLSIVVKRKGPLKVDQACDYVRQAALGLQHAHENGMVHRDIKPHNLMVTSDGRIKILDFGLATLTTEALPRDETNQTSARDADDESSPSLTSAGSMMGTPDFISPEQASDARAADIRSDIYSLGCTFYYLLTGRPPFSKGLALERIKAHAERDAEPIENVRDHVPPELTEILRRMMAKEPAARFQTPTEVADALAPFVDAHRTSEKATTDGLVPAMSSSILSWWPPSLALSLVCLGIAFILAGVIYVTTDNGKLIVESEDDSVEVVVRMARDEAAKGDDSREQLRIVDTLTGSAVKRLWSGKYVLALKGGDNDFKLDKDLFVLRRGDKVIVKVTRRVDSQRIGLSPTVRRVWAEPIDTAGSPSPDGRLLTFNDWGSRELAVRNLETGEKELIKSPWTGFPYSHVWSPDGQQIACSWDDGSRVFDLRVIGRDGTNPRVLIHDDEMPYMVPLAWSKNGEIAVAVQAQDGASRLLMVSLEDGSHRTLVSDWKWPLHTSLSPDGRYVVYDVPQEDGSSKRDIVLVPTDGGNERRLVDHPAHDYAPVWAPDGKRVVFTSDRNESTNLWVLNVETGDSRGAPRPIPVDMNRMLPMAMTQDGTYFYRHLLKGQTATDIYIVSFDPTTGELLSSPEKATQQYEGWYRRRPGAQFGRV